MKTIGDTLRDDVRVTFRNYREAQERFAFLKQCGFETGPLFDQAAKIVQREGSSYAFAQGQLASLLGVGQS